MLIMSTYEPFRKFGDDWLTIDKDTVDELYSKNQFIVVRWIVGGKYRYRGVFDIRIDQIVKLINDKKTKFASTQIGQRIGVHREDCIKVK